MEFLYGWILISHTMCWQVPAWKNWQQTRGGGGVWTSALLHGRLSCYPLIHHASSIILQVFFNMRKWWPSMFVHKLADPGLNSASGIFFSFPYYVYSWTIHLCTHQKVIDLTVSQGDNKTHFSIYSSCVKLYIYVIAHVWVWVHAFMKKRTMYMRKRSYVVWLKLILFFIVFPRWTHPGKSN